LRTWGGARNRADRESDGVTVEQARRVLAAAEHARRVGVPLNRHCTIHWERAGVPDADAARATGDYLKRAADWHRLRRLPFAWTYVRENGPDKGSHVHILLHLPAVARVTFLARHWRWIKFASRRRYVAGTILSKAVGGKLAADGAGPVYAENLAYALGYVLKGVSRVDALTLELRRRPRRDGTAPDNWGQGGRIIGKRVGASENLGASSRQTGAEKVCERPGLATSTKVHD
jgi:hypothetical protein